MTADPSGLLTAAPQPPRTNCSIAFCKRTRQFQFECVAIEGHLINFTAEWICGKHWPTVPRSLKEAHYKAKRRVKAEKTIEAERAASDAWRDCKEAANMIAAGLL